MPNPTIKDLLINATKKSPLKPPKTSGKFEFGPPSYPWNANSCWLDASLEILYTAITVDFIDFFNVSGDLDPDGGLGALYTLIRDRLSLNSALKSANESASASVTLGVQRDKFRQFLHDKEIIQHVDQFESAVVYLS